MNMNLLPAMDEDGDRDPHQSMILLKSRRREKMNKEVRTLKGWSTH
ncbi:hypothetical protein LEMLEM_LOCUS7542 [Lemmus lemmus]